MNLTKNEKIRLVGAILITFPFPEDKEEYKKVKEDLKLIGKIMKVSDLKNVEDKRIFKFLDQEV